MKYKYFKNGNTGSTEFYKVADDGTYWYYHPSQTMDMPHMTFCDKWIESDDKFWQRAAEDYKVIAITEEELFMELV